MQSGFGESGEPYLDPFEDLVNPADGLSRCGTLGESVSYAALEGGRRLKRREAAEREFHRTDVKRPRDADRVFLV